MDTAGTGVVSTVWLVGVGIPATADRSVDVGCPNWRRAQASIAHIVGGSTGATGLSETKGLIPTDARIFDTMPDTTFGGAVGALDAVGIVGVCTAIGVAEPVPAAVATASCVVVCG